MSLGTKIKELRENHNYSQIELAELIGVTDSSISSWENDQKIPRMGAIEKMSQIFGVPKSVIMDLDNDSDNINKVYYPNLFGIQRQKIPFLGEIACGKPIFANEERESYVEVGTNIKADFCLKANGDSMINARINDGDIVFIKKQDMVNNGEIAAVIIEDEATLKRVFYDPKKGKLVLQAENPKYPPMMFVGEELNQIHILGLAIAFQSDVI